MRRRSASASRKSGHTRLKKEEVSQLLDQLHSEERSEHAWQEMIADGPDEGDAFSDVEEHLIHQPHERDPQLRRWKYFGK